MKKTLTQKEKDIWEDLQIEEKGFLKDLDNWKYQVVENLDTEKTRMETIVTFNISKRKPINIRPLEVDILKMKSIAVSRGIPYQTLINSVIHQFVNDKLVEKRL